MTITATAATTTKILFTIVVRWLLSEQKADLSKKVFKNTLICNNGVNEID